MRGHGREKMVGAGRFWELEVVGQAAKYPYNNEIYCLGTPLIFKGQVGQAANFWGFLVPTYDLP